MMYIRATGNISAQKSFGRQPFLAEPVEFFGNRLTCTEPDYKDIIDPKLIRRMSRIIRMGVAAAKDCLEEAGIEKPGAIVTGTAYGCLEDTGLFLGKMIEFKEELLTPTAFIQSTHNTIGAQVGLMLQCNNYNNAFVHRGFSFESALQDAIMLIREKSADNVLAGAIDEITDTSHAILERFGFYKRENISNLGLFHSNSDGTVAGEGSSFFLLSAEPAAGDYARLDGLATFYKPGSAADIEKEIISFLDSQGVSPADIDLVITGRNGDKHSDKIIDELEKGLFRQVSCIGFKHLCGEFPTASGFALWIASNILKRKDIPRVLVNENVNKNKLNRVLIWNHFQNIHHSLYLLTSC